MEIQERVRWQAVSAMRGWYKLPPLPMRVQTLAMVELYGACQDGNLSALLTNNKKRQSTNC
jgi:hypothetical protein